MAQEQGQPSEKKIIIDEDWKSQVHAEKEQAALPNRDKEKSQRPPLPPANISFLFSTLVTQAFIALGILPNPVTEKIESDLEQAKHLIDTLGVLEEKTKGNLTPDEKRYLDSALFDLRLQYVEARSKSPQGTTKPE